MSHQSLAAETPGCLLGFIRVKAVSLIAVGIVAARNLIENVAVTAHGDEDVTFAHGGQGGVKYSFFLFSAKSFSKEYSPCVI